MFREAVPSNIKRDYIREARSDTQRPSDPHPDYSVYPSKVTSRLRLGWLTHSKPENLGVPRVDVSPLLVKVGYLTYNQVLYL